MKTLNRFTGFLFCLSLAITVVTNAQIVPGVYMAEADGIRHELKIKDDYFIHSAYQVSPPEFIKTVGGFYTLADSILQAKLEFNSNHAEDRLEQLALKIIVQKNQLTLPMDGNLLFEKKMDEEQVLDGTWLFATRGPDEGQERRGEENPRKTLKFLQDGRFQWIAYNTDTMEFFGTGGGAFTSKNGKYIENIEYFSRDNSRVGAKLDFDYQIKNGDWHHTGTNSKGEPMYEIWVKRE